MVLEIERGRMATDPGAERMAHVEEALAALRAELGALQMSKLKKRAIAAGAAAEQIETAEDADDPKGALIEMVLEIERSRMSDDPGAGHSGRPEEAVEALRGELEALKMSALKKRAVTAGAGAEEMDSAEDADDPKEALIAMVIERERSRLAAAPCAEPAAQEEDAMTALRKELELLKISALKKRAAAAGPSPSVAHLPV